MVSNHIKLTSQDFYKAEDSIPNAVLDENDPVLDIKRLAGVSEINSGKLQEYKGYNSINTEGSNISKTAIEKINYQNNHNVQPGTPEWFRLWFSKPYLTGETPW